METGTPGNRPKLKNYITELGVDLTEYMTNDSQIELFWLLCEAESRTHRPLKECYLDVVEVLNLEAQIKGKPKRAFVQANPNLN